MSPQDQDQEIGRLLREHSERNQEYIALGVRLKRIGQILQHASSGLVSVGQPGTSNNLTASRQQLASLVGEIDVSSLLSLIDEHAHLGEKLRVDRETLKPYGVA